MLANVSSFLTAQMVLSDQELRVLFGISSRPSFQGRFPQRNKVCGHVALAAWLVPQKTGELSRSG